MVSEAFVAEKQYKRIQLTQVIENPFEQEDKSQYYFHEHTQNSSLDKKSPSFEQSMMTCHRIVATLKYVVEFSVNSTIYYAVFSGSNFWVWIKT